MWVSRSGEELSWCWTAIHCLLFTLLNFRRELSVSTTDRQWIDVEFAAQWGRWVDRVLSFLFLCTAWLSPSQILRYYNTRFKETCLIVYWFCLDSHLNHFIITYSSQLTMEWPRDRDLPGQEAQLPQSDRATRHVSWNLVSCCKSVQKYNK